GSPQIIELFAVVLVFKRWSAPINIITDSAYVAGLVLRLEHSFLKEVSNETLFVLLWELKWLPDNRAHSYFIQHIRSQTSLCGPISDGNPLADKLAGAVVVPDHFAQAQLSHEFYHQNTSSNNSKRQTCQARRRGGGCSSLLCVSEPPWLPPPIPATGGVNPRGLSCLEIWQTDVTHIPEFGKLKYVHVSVDTFSICVYASVHAGEKVRDVCRHFVMPKSIKTDNGPGYVAHKTQFFQQWGIQHTTGIPHSPTGQAITERTHGTLKSVLQKQ
ncbi:PO113 protein, partial [Bucco capensis]|nr:PO113 protein [Bucco capensis]